MRVRFLPSAALLVAAACAGDDNQVAATYDPDTSTATVDTAPGSVAAGVAVLLTGENILALLDTAYAVAEEKATLARSRAQSREIRSLADQAAERHRTARRDIARVAAEHGISPILPEEDLLAEQRAELEELRRASGAAFDRIYIEREIRTNQELVDRVEDALDDPGNVNIAEFLRGQRAKLNTEIQALVRMRDLGAPGRDTTT